MSAQDQYAAHNVIAAIQAELSAALAAKEAAERGHEDAKEFVRSNQARADRAERHADGLRRRCERAEAQVRAVEAAINDPSVTYSTFCGEPCCAPPTDEKSTPMMVERDAIRVALAAVAPSEPRDEVLFRTPDDWCELFGLIVLDPDGWRSDGQSWNQPVAREEFNRRANMSTIGPASSEPQGVKP